MDYKIINNIVCWVDPLGEEPPTPVNITKMKKQLQNIDKMRERLTVEIVEVERLQKEIKK
jgi:hypothetical protein